MPTRIFTIGFTRKNAETFFELLRTSGVRRVVDVRLNNIGQLAGFTRKQDLPYFLDRICGMDYLHLTELAPTDDLLTRYRHQEVTAEEFEQECRKLIEERRIEEVLSRVTLDGACLLCSEESPAHCHRRIVAEYLQERWGDVEIVHLH